jgi:galactitol-specific phosphotransferase system IIC component
VQAVGLHQVWMTAHAVEKKWHQRDFFLGGDVAVNIGICGRWYVCRI